WSQGEGPTMHAPALEWIDYVVMLVYFAFVLGIGFALKRYVKSSTDFFLAGRSIPAWVCGLAFISANLGAQEVIGMGASGAMYGMAKLIQSLHIFDRMFEAVGLPSTWIFHAGILISGVIVLAYILLGGLTSAMYNEVLQFFFIVAGFLPLVWLGLRNVGGWSG